MHVTIIGARGYLGRELMRLLLDHPEVDQVSATSTSDDGPVKDSLPTLRRARELRFTEPESSEALDADVVFMATHAGEAAPRVAAHEEAGVQCCIDLSRDHRLQAIAGKDGWHYGWADILPVSKGTRRIANPGCYPTATMLAMAPLLQAGLIGSGPRVVDGKSGVSGAGASPREDLHFPAMNESVRAYKPAGHDHTFEIRDAANRLAGQAGIPEAPVRFTPHLVPMTRGLLSTSYLNVTQGASIDEDAIQNAYARAYDDRPFVHFVAEPDTGRVRGSNHAETTATYDPETHMIIARTAIDNLLKGGSGTAVQNMNDALGFHPTAGLTAEAPSP